MIIITIILILAMFYIIVQMSYRIDEHSKKYLPYEFLDIVCTTIIALGIAGLICLNWNKVQEKPKVEYEKIIEPVYKLKKH